MAKSTKKAAAAAAAPAPTGRKRPAAYKPESKIVIVEGENARRVVRSLAVDRAMQAMRAHPTVGEFVAKFGAECDKKPLPGRGSQPGPTQAAAILRWLEGQQAVTVK